MQQAAFVHTQTINHDSQLALAAMSNNISLFELS